MVQVTFIDAESGASLGVASLEPGALPESFAQATQLELAGGEWLVMKATPPTREEFSRTGALVLELRRVVTVDPRDILFSLPTVENVLPGFTDTVATDTLDLLEDDWRQLELIDPKHRALVQQELAAIHAIERRGAGFLRLHVRKAIPAPLAIADDLGGTRRGLSIDGRVVEHGFSIGELYGVSHAGLITTLGATSPGALEPLAQRLGLMLVDWLRD